MGCNYTVSIDQKGDGQAENSAVLRSELFVSHQDGKRHWTALQKVVDRRGVIVHGDGDDLQTARSVRFLPLRKAGHLYLARSAPRGPEIEQDYLAFECGQIDVVLCEVGAGELRRGTVQHGIAVGCGRGHGGCCRNH
jgi:hypothetical protein